MLVQMYLVNSIENPTEHTEVLFVAENEVSSWVFANDFLNLKRIKTFLENAEKGGENSHRALETLLSPAEDNYTISKDEYVRFLGTFTAESAWNELKMLRLLGILDDAEALYKYKPQVRYV